MKVGLIGLANGRVSRRMLRQVLKYMDTAETENT